MPDVHESSQRTRRARTHAAHADNEEDAHPSDRPARRERHTRDEQSRDRQHSGAEQVLHHRRPTVRPRYVQPVVLKQGSLFLLCTREGDVLPDSDQGLYFHDMRHLCGQTLRISGVPAVPLLADASDGARGAFELTTPDLRDARGRVVVRKEMLGIQREKVLGDDYAETLRFTNYGDERITVELELWYAADFADMFVVRGMPPEQRGTLHDPVWHGNALRWVYDGADDHCRSTTLHLNRAPRAHDGGTVRYRLALRPRQTWELRARVEVEDRVSGGRHDRPSGAEGPGQRERAQARAGAMGAGTQVQTSNELFDQVLTRSFMDLHMLRTKQGDDVFFAAGVPWYVALFGRDSLVTGLEVAAFEPDILAHTLRVLAARQGTRVDDWRDEQPGKILHEYRVDEMANLDEIPQSPYFGSVDSTPLFLVALGMHARWAGTLDVFHELRDNVEAALRWIDDYGDADGDGFVDYQTHSKRGGRNQGWKDSGNGVVMEDGSLAEPPIALPEVQGDVYLAWTLVADLLERDGYPGQADDLRQKAKRLYDAFNRQFWLADEEFYAFCRQADGRFSRSIASNPGHTLWTGIVNPRRAGKIVQRLLRPDMFCGWGVRTLSAEDRSYNPIDYQLGSVWPHDNAFIVAGMQRYGFCDAAAQVFGAIKDAAARFEHFRLPEVFAGFDRAYSGQPVEYPVACNPQAWAAGAVPFMLASMLGLQPDGFTNCLTIHRPHLPDWLNWVQVRGLRVGQGSVDLRYERNGELGTLVAVTGRQGDLRIVVEH